MEEPIELPPGTELDGRFRIGKLLGEGGMGFVYQAEDLERGHDVALKILIPRYRGRPEREQRLLNEAAFAQRVGEHPALPRLYGFGRLRDLDGCPYLSWEVVNGRDLNAVLTLRYRIQPRVAMHWSRQLADALCVMHRAGVVHRDVTVTNVFIEDPDGDARVKLIDLSHAAFVPEPGAQTRRLTREFEIPGAHGFMPPEQTLALPPHPKMDVFSFGVVLHEMLTGSNPFEHVRDRDTYIEMQRAGRLHVPRIDRRAYPQVSEALVDLVEGCTRNHVAKRLDMPEVLRQLDRMLARRAAPMALVGDELWEPTAATVPGSRASADAARVEGRPNASRADFAGATRVEATPQDPRAIIVGPDPGEPAPQDSRAVVGVGKVEDASPLEERRGALRAIVLIALAMVALTAAALFLVWPQDENATAHELAPLERAPSGNEPGAQGTLPRVDPEAPVVEPDEPEPTSSVTTAVEHELAVEPESGEPEPTEDRAPMARKPTRPTSRRKPPGGGKTEAPDAEECERTVAAARAAEEGGSWVRLEVLTRKSKCFEDRSQWARLRTHALLETGRFAECSTLADRFPDPFVQKYARICRAQKERP